MDTRRLGVLGLGFALFALLDGFVLGVLAGLFVRPLQADASLQYAPDEYVSLVAASYALDADLTQAQARLRILEPDAAQFPALLAEASARAEARRDRTWSFMLADLSRALAGGPFAANAAAHAPTPLPTFTQTPVRLARAAVSADLPATATPTATARPTATPTRTRTPTPRPTITRTLTRRPTATATPVVPVAVPPSATPATPVPVPVSVPAVDYQIQLVRQLTACENGGNHHLFILVLDKQGAGIPKLGVEVVWPSGSFKDFTGQKVENIPALGVNAQTTAGYLNYPMYRGSYRVRVLDGVSEQTSWLTVDIPRGEYCAASDNPQGNSLFHYSYLIVFQKVR